MTVIRSAKPWWLALVILLLVLPVLLVAAGQVGSVSCVACHQMRPFVSAHKQSGHASVRCLKCHREPGIAGVADFAAREGLSMVPAALAGKKMTGPEGRMSSSGCTERKCHSDGPVGVTFAKGLRVRHVSCAQSESCTDCHGGVAHGSKVRWARGFEMERCVACHGDRNAPIVCETCHPGKVDREQITSTAWRVTHGPDWERAHGMGDLQSCVTCHHPDYCKRCHGVALPHPPDFGSTHGGPARQVAKKCEQCHEKKSFCNPCHGVPMPHGSAFLPKHSKIAKSAKDVVCIRCHLQEDCDNCHTRHIHPGGTAGRLGGVLMPKIEARP